MKILKPFLLLPSEQVVNCYPVSYSKGRKKPPQEPKFVWWKRKSSDWEWELWDIHEFQQRSIEGHIKDGNMFYAYN